MSLTKEQTYTIEDIYNLPEGQRAELIDGQLFMRAAPSRRHQEISGYLFNKIYNHISANGGKCKVYAAPFAVYLNGDESEYFEPDITVICSPEKLDDKGCKGAPDWIIEIASPSTASIDYLLKSTKYHRAGVREYWIVNPKSQAVTVYYFNGDDFTPWTYTFKDKIKVKIYADFIIDFGELASETP